MNNHDDIRKHLSAYCGDDLEPAERIRVEGHLADCAACRAELADLQTALSLIRATPEVEPPPWLAARIMARVREQQREKRSLLQRIFFPLHLKLPLEALALLLVCVSGYYMARTVETELQQPVTKQETSAAPPKTGSPARVSTNKAPAALPPTSPHPAPVTGKTSGSETSMPARPAAPKAADQVAPQHEQEYFGTPPPQPLFSPAPPNIKEERAAPADEPTYGSSRSYQHIPGAKKGKMGALEKKNTTLNNNEQDVITFETARSASTSGSGVARLQVRIRLSLTTPAAAPESLKEAIIRSSGSLTDDGRSQPRTLKVRIPSPRMGELLVQLERLGRIVERPRIPDTAGMVELEIDW